MGLKIGVGVTVYRGVGVAEGLAVGVAVGLAVGVGVEGGSTVGVAEGVGVGATRPSVRSTWYVFFVPAYADQLLKSAWAS